LESVATGVLVIYIFLIIFIVFKFHYAHFAAKLISYTHTR
jgi:hypothetical protein